MLFRPLLFLFLSFLLATVLLLLPFYGAASEKGVNGGVYCGTCTAVMAILDHLSSYHNESLRESRLRLCSYMPKEWRYCKPNDENANDCMKEMTRGKNLGLTPDDFCREMNFCRTEEGRKECNVFPKKLKALHTETNLLRFRRSAMTRRTNLTAPKWDKCTLLLLNSLKNLYEGVFETPSKTKLPSSSSDKDGDHFSPINTTYRGSFWHGKDCDDSRADVHPGAIPVNGDISSDSNCNGIHGKFPDESGRSLEDVYCNDSLSKSMGIIALGDSAMAHFHIPPEWFDVKRMDNESFDSLRMSIKNEFDWPMLSMSTGYMNSSWKSIRTPTKSIYQYLVEINRCNRNDFQNLAFNGATMSRIDESLARQWTRNKTHDKPAIVLLAVIGNDVCRSNSKMTNAEDMRKHTKSVLNQLDKLLPVGSHVVIIGMADGRILYDYLHYRFHPIGKLNLDVTYDRVYDYANCLQISPCRGFMTTNGTLRNLTYERVHELNKIIQDEQRNFKSENIKVYYLDHLYEEVNKIVRQEFPFALPEELVEAVDGFHPGQYVETKSAEVLWTWMKREISEVTGAVNPYNDVIDGIVENH
eukprot:m.40143 g.40143  ORF g.40143 m.40143 type:complete len:584 (+) comp32911_c0_seq2:344-2095(+)